jgi:hypothetical protein
MTSKQEIGHIGWQGTDGTSEETAEDFDSTNYWCLQTMKNFGPDDEMVGGRECRDAARSCYEPF